MSEVLKYAEHILQTGALIKRAAKDYRVRYTMKGYNEDAELSFMLEVIAFYNHYNEDYYKERYRPQEVELKITFWDDGVPFSYDDYAGDSFDYDERKAVYKDFFAKVSKAYDAQQEERRERLEGKIEKFMGEE